MSIFALRPDYSSPCGRIKPMHCINNAPLSWAEDGMFHYLGEAGIPVSRLHDTGGMYGGGVYVDVDNIFRRPAADPDDPAAYDFAYTDWLLTHLDAVGCKPFYRLGCTIENHHKEIRPYRIIPPNDPEKWAEVCRHIVAHYNEGWANGFHMGIEYWEIWNEPDNEPIMEDNPMWRGTMEQFFELYEITANKLKKSFPACKIGGYASCGFYDILNRKAQAQANVSTRTGYFIEFFEKFLTHITTEGHKAPLDFFSWHSYSGPDENVQYAAYARRMLDTFGFTGTESILNEWNPGFWRRGQLVDGAYIGQMFIAMQNAPVDMLAYYDGQLTSSYGGLFDPVSRQPFKAYHVFRAFHELYRLGTQYPLIGASPDGRIADTLYALAAGRDHVTAGVTTRVTAGATADSTPDAEAILLCNTGSARLVEAPAGGAWTLYLIDQRYDLSPVCRVNGGEAFSVPTEGTALIMR